MLRLTRILDQPLDPVQTARALRICLAYHDRVKSRLVVQPTDGPAAAIMLARGSAMRDGDVLVGDDGSLAIVAAALEPITRVTARSTAALMRAVYHLANRHVPVQLAADHLLIERDPVLERMLVALGVGLEHVELPFDPEPGAYRGHDGTGHRHGEELDHESATMGEQLSIEAHRARSASS